MDFEKKERIIQEFVPGRQITLTHIITNPVPKLYAKLGIVDVKNPSLDGFSHLYA